LGGGGKGGRIRKSEVGSLAFEQVKLLRTLVWLIKNSLEGYKDHNAHCPYLKNMNDAYAD